MGVTGESSTVDPEAPGEPVPATGAEGTGVATPTSEQELAELLAAATARGSKVAIVGGRTHRDMGYPVEPDLVVSTSGLAGIEDWEPDDLTVVVGAGTTVADLEEQLSGGRQSAVLPEYPATATVGGVVAAGVSGYRRLRYGPTRDRMLEVRAVTGDGRLVKGGGRVVKNVSGYDLPRLYTGSLGSLGVVTSVCLKLWPLQETTATVALDGVPPPGSVYRPLAVLETRDGVRVLLAGTRSEVDAQADRLDGDVRAGLDYPEPVSGEVVWSLRLRPALLSDARDRLPAGADFVIQHGVGEVAFGTSRDFDVAPLRQWAEARGGALVRLKGRSDADPWGTPPAGLDLQRRIVAAFDPGRILEPGRLPGRI